MWIVSRGAASPQVGPADEDPAAEAQAAAENVARLGDIGEGAEPGRPRLRRRDEDSQEEASPAALAASS